MKRWIVIVLSLTVLFGAMVLSSCGDEVVSGATEAGSVVGGINGGYCGGRTGGCVDGCFYGIGEGCSGGEGIENVGSAAGENANAGVHGVSKNCADGTGANELGSCIGTNVGGFCGGCMDCFEVMGDSMTMDSISADSNPNNSSKK